MKRIFCIVLAAAALAMLPALVSADDYPSGGPTIGQPHAPNSAAQQKLYYGYVPPPPIRHTWPGGYRVIIHELMNTLAEHWRGWY